MKHTYTKWDKDGLNTFTGKNTGGWVFDSEKAKEGFEDAYVVDGVVCWKSNDSIPPTDILSDWSQIGMPFNYEKSVTVKEKEDSEAIAEYVERRKNHVPSDEEMYEMRAAFGKGETVVDVFTGKKIVL